MGLNALHKAAECGDSVTLQRLIRLGTIHLDKPAMSGLFEGVGEGEERERKKKKERRRRRTSLTFYSFRCECENSLYAFVLRKRGREREGRKEREGEKESLDPTDSVDRLLFTSPTTKDTVSARKFSSQQMRM